MVNSVPKAPKTQMGPKIAHGGHKSPPKASNWAKMSRNVEGGTSKIIEIGSGSPMRHETSAKIEICSKHVKIR